jgi:HEAT repeat protein
MTESNTYVDKLIEALHHEEPLTRIRAAWLLGRLREQRAVRTLIAAVETYRADPEFLAAAATALGEIGDADGVPTLRRLARSSPLKSRLAAVRSLSRWADRAGVRVTLRSALRDRNALIRDAAREELGIERARR